MSVHHKEFCEGTSDMFRLRCRLSVSAGAGGLAGRRFCGSSGTLETIIAEHFQQIILV
jgi:hypothetical protein